MDALEIGVGNRDSSGSTFGVISGDSSWSANGGGMMCWKKLFVVIL